MKGIVLFNPQHVLASRHWRCIVDSLNRPRVLPMMRFSMTVRKTDITTPFMQHRRQIHHFPRCRLRFIKLPMRGERGIVDRLRPLFNEHEHIRRRRQPNLRKPAIGLRMRRRPWRPEEMIHRQRPDPPVLLSTKIHLIRAGGTSPEFGRGDVSRNQALLQKSHVGAIRRTQGLDAFHPRFTHRYTCTTQVYRNKIIVVTRIKMKRQPELFHVRQATCRHCPRLGRR